MSYRLEKLEKIVKLEELRIRAEYLSNIHSNDYFAFGKEFFHKQRAETYLAIANRIDKRINTLIKEL